MVDGNCITVVSLTIPGRAAMLTRCIESVYKQTIRPYAHLILAEANRRDVGACYNEAISGVKTPWIQLCDDDNFLLPHHLETILPAMEDADVVYSWETSGSRPRVNFNGWHPEKIIEYQEHENAIDNSCAIRTDVFRAVGFDETSKTPKDWLLFTELAHRRVRFRCVPQETWTYSMVEHDGRMWMAHELRERGIEVV